MKKTKTENKRTNEQKVVNPLDDLLDQVSKPKEIPYGMTELAAACNVDEWLHRRCELTNAIVEQTELRVDDIAKAKEIVKRIHGRDSAHLAFHLTEAGKKATLQELEKVMRFGARLLWTEELAKAYTSPTPNTKKNHVPLTIAEQKHRENAFFGLFVKMAEGFLPSFTWGIRDDMTAVNWYKPDTTNAE